MLALLFLVDGVSGAVVVAYDADVVGGVCFDGDHVAFFDGGEAGEVGFLGGDFVVTGFGDGVDVLDVELLFHVIGDGFLDAAVHAVDGCGEGVGHLFGFLLLGWFCVCDFCCGLLGDLFDGFCHCGGECLGGALGHGGFDVDGFCPGCVGALGFAHFEAYFDFGVGRGGGLVLAEFSYFSGEFEFWVGHGGGGAGVGESVGGDDGVGEGAGDAVAGLLGPFVVGAVLEGLAEAVEGCHLGGVGAGDVEGAYAEGVLGCGKFWDGGRGVDGVVLGVDDFAGGEASGEED